MTATAARAGGDSFGVGAIATAFCLALFLGLVACSAAAPEFTRQYVRGELGGLESLQALLLGVTLLATLWLLAAPRSSGEPGLRIWLLLVAVGVFLLLAEEISWGQHYFGWATTGWFDANNDQGETNFHNTSAWLDQKPRGLLLLGVIVGGLLNPLVRAIRKGRGLLERPWWLAPSSACVGPAVFVVLGGMPERLAEWGLIPRLQYLRSSEMEELFLYIFMLTYLVALAAALKRRRDS